MIETPYPQRRDRDRYAPRETLLWFPRSGRVPGADAGVGTRPKVVRGASEGDDEALTARR
jgi:hypothetical protein